MKLAFYESQHCPCCPAITTALGNRTILPTVFVTGSTPPDITVARSTLPGLFHLQQFGKTLSLSLSLSLYKLFFVVFWCLPI
jgi:hypothetical protein